MSKYTTSFQIGEHVIGGGAPFYFFAGPCVIESEKIVMDIAEKVLSITTELSIPYCFKASFDKANRSSIKSFRGPGLKEGLKILKKVKDTFGLPILTDVHEVSQVKLVAEVADVIQIPAFLCRQTDLLIAAAESGRVVNVKKGQFLAPGDMINAVNKIVESGNEKIILTERGATFGYNNLVVDMRSLVIMREMGYPIMYDATHSVMLPGGAGDCSGGDRKFIPHLARAAAAVGCDGIFMEVHLDPEAALCDKDTVFPISQLKETLKSLKDIDNLVKK